MIRGIPPTYIYRLILLDSAILNKETLPFHRRHYRGVLEYETARHASENLKGLCSSVLRRMNRHGVGSSCAITALATRHVPSTDVIWHVTGKGQALTTQYVTSRNRPQRSARFSSFTQQVWQPSQDSPPHCPKIQRF